MPEIMIARRNGFVTGPNGRRRVHRGKTTAHADHPIVAGHPNLWEQLKVDYETEAVDDTSDDQPPAQGGAAPPPAEEPVDNAAVREWAAQQDPVIEVSPKGKIPQSVIDQYRAAHSG